MLIYYIKRTEGTSLTFFSIWNLKSLYFTYSHSSSFVLSLAVIRCHSLSFFVIRCHSFLFRCHYLYHSLSLVVPLVLTHCHSLYHLLSFVAPLVVTRYTTRLSFYFLNAPLSATIYFNVYYSQAYSEPCQTSKIERFAKVFNGKNPSTIFTQWFILDVLQNFKYAPATIL